MQTKTRIEQFLLLNFALLLFSGNQAPKVTKEKK